MSQTHHTLVELPTPLGKIVPVVIELTGRLLRTTTVVRCVRINGENSATTGRIEWNCVYPSLTFFFFYPSLRKKMREVISTQERARPETEAIG